MITKLTSTTNFEHDNMKLEIKSHNVQGLMNTAVGVAEANGTTLAELRGWFEEVVKRSYPKG